MPLCSDLLTKRWSTVELPILPFLAPRVFTPWPSKGRRAHTGAQPLQKSNTNDDSYGISPRTLREEEQRRMKQEFSLRSLAAKDDNAPKQPPKKAVNERRKTSKSAWGGSRNVYGARAGSVEEPTESSSAFSFDDEFRRKYEEIWGIGQMPRFDIARVQAKKKENNEAVSAREESDRFCGVRLVDSIISSERGQAFVPKHVKIRLKKRRDASRLQWKHVDKTPGHALSSILAWKKRFALLHIHQKEVVDGQGLPKLVTSRKMMTDPAFRKALMESDSSTSLHKVWEALSPWKRRDIWSELMLSTLDEHPTRALKFLAATYEHPYPPGYAVADSFNYIVSYYLRDRTTRNPKNALDIFKAFEQMLRLGPPHHFHLRQSSVYLLLKNLDNGFVGRLFQILTEYDHRLHKHTLMQFASKLRLSGGTDERMEVLQRLWQDGSDFNSPEMISVCVTLLQLKNRVSEVAYSDSEIFEFMLKCGLMPNIVVYNVLLQNSLEAGDHKTGWKIHDMMVENGIETDVYTYSLLLSDAKLRHDQSSIERIINIVSEKDIRNAHVVTDLLHAIFIYSGTSPSWEKRKRGRPSKTFERMLLVYRQYFHLEPLKRLIPWLESSYPNTIPVSNKTLMDAPIPALVVMLTALLRQLSEPGTVVQFYNHFCSLVQAADPVVKELSKSTHVYNIILKALGDFQDTLALCPRLIGDMLSQNIAATSEILGTSPHTSTDENQSSPQEYRSMHDDLETRNTPTQDHALSGTLTGLFSTEQRSDTVQAHPISVTSVTTSQRGLYPKPDVYTWSVLLKAFMDHGQPRAAEKVLAMMKDRGVWPNQVTWNKLIIGYARMQDMSMTVDSVNRLHKGGFDLDGFTMKGLAYFQNRRALIEAMKASETSDPEGSLKKQSAEIGRARTASNKTMKMVRDGLEPVADVTDEMRGTQDRENELLSSTGRTEREEEFVVRDIQRL